VVDAIAPPAGIQAVNTNSEAPTSWHDLSWFFIGVRGSFFIWVSLYETPCAYFSYYLEQDFCYFKPIFLNNKK
jgi:hypothetical protein